MSELDARLEHLRVLLGHACALLDSYGEERWVSWLTECQACLRESPRVGLDRLLAAYGGMGSFNDVTLRRVEGRLRSSLEIAMGPPPWSEEDRAADARLHRLRGDIWQEAKALQEMVSCG